MVDAAAGAGANTDNPSGDHRAAIRDAEALNDHSKMKAEADAHPMRFPQPPSIIDLVHRTLAQTRDLATYTE